MIPRTAAFASCLLAFAPTASSAQTTQTLPFRLAHSGKPLKMVFMFSIEPDCRSLGQTALTLVVPPSNGEISTRNASDFPSLSPSATAFACTRRRVPGTQVFYKARAGYAGPDTFTIQAQFPSGVVRNFKYDLVVQ